MNVERFETLAQAYGGDIRRWPAAEQDAAFARLAAEPRAQAVLLAAGALDAALNAVPPLVASEHLRQRILFAAPKGRPLVGRMGAWGSGLALAAACAAGVMIGVNNASLLDTPAVQQVQIASTPAQTSTAVAATQASSAVPAASTTPTTSETATEAAGFYYGGDWFSGLESEG